MEPSGELTRADGKATAATITINSYDERLVLDEALRELAFGTDYPLCRFSLGPAPGERGTEVHVSSNVLDKKTLKAGLRDFRALVEADEIPTGASHR